MNPRDIRVRTDTTPDENLRLAKKGYIELVPDFRDGVEHRRFYHVASQTILVHENPKETSN